MSNKRLDAFKHLRLLILLQGGGQLERRHLVSDTELSQFQSYYILFLKSVIFEQGVCSFYITCFLYHVSLFVLLSLLERGYRENRGSLNQMLIVIKFKYLLRVHTTSYNNITHLYPYTSIPHAKLKE